MILISGSYKPHLQHRPEEAGVATHRRLIAALGEEGALGRPDDGGADPEQGRDRVEQQVRRPQERDHERAASSSTGSTGRRFIRAAK